MTPKPLYSSCAWEHPPMVSFLFPRYSQCSNFYLSQLLIPLRVVQLSYQSPKTTLGCGCPGTLPWTLSHSYWWHKWEGNSSYKPLLSWARIIAFHFQVAISGWSAVGAMTAHWAGLVSMKKGTAEVQRQVMQTSGIHKMLESVAGAITLDLDVQDQPSSPGASMVAAEVLLFCSLGPRLMSWEIGGVWRPSPCAASWLCFCLGRKSADWKVVWILAEL